MKSKTPVQRRRSAPTIAPPGAQRGAAAVFAAIAIVAMIISFLLAINIGSLYYAQRDLQKQATMAALAGAQVGSGCNANGVPNTSTSNGSPLWTAVNAAILANNGNNSGAAGTALSNANAIQVGWVNSASGQKLPPLAGTSSYTDPGNGLVNFHQLSSGDPRINAVRVTLVAAPPPLIGGFLTASAPQLQASATATQQAVGSFYLGTGLAGINTTNSPLLNPLLQALLCGGAPSSACSSQVSLVAASYTGLAGANISLGNLLGAATSANVGITDLASLLNTNLSLPQWMGILGTALSTTVDGTTGQVSNGVAGLVQGLAGVSYSNGSTFNLGTILNTAGLDLNPTVSAAVGAVPFVDGLDLLAALGEAAQASPPGPGGTTTVTPIALPVTITLPGGVSLGVFVSIGSPAKFAVGPAGSTSAQTADITLMIRLSGGSLLSTLFNVISGAVNLVLGLVSLLTLGLIQSSINIIPAPLNLGIDVNVAAANASLTKLQCPTNVPPATTSPTVNIDGTSAVVTLNVGPFTGSATSNPTPLSPSNSYVEPLAEVKVNANAAGLGNTDTTISLALTSASVGSTPFTLDPVTQFLPPSGTPLSYVAYGAPSYPAATNGDNPQTVGSTLNLALQLGLTSSDTGSGLLGAISGLITSVLNSIQTLLNGLLTLVNGLLTALIEPLLSLLGVQVGTATVIVDAVTVAPPIVVTNVPPPAGNAGS